MKKNIIAIILSFFILMHATYAHAFSDKIYKELGTFSKIMEIVDRYYVEEPEEKELVRGAIRGMLYTLDPHTVYLPEDVYKDFKSDTQGRFGGVGIEVTVKDGFITVVSPIEGSPAQRAGIQAGDKILMINGKITKGMDLTEAVHLMRGTIGKKITLAVWHAGMKQPRQVILEREIIKVANVLSEDLSDNYAYFRITVFQEGTAKNLKKAITKYKREHGGLIKGIVLDLRDNPGGLLSEAIRISDYFLDHGVIVSTKGRDHVEEVKKARGPGTLPDYPLIVLINGGSASASEIVAGALQDQGRAKLIGTRSYGKGSVQTVINLDDGDAIKITVARYYTPKNRMIDGKGIDPDILVGRNEFKKKTQSEVKEENGQPSLKAYNEYQKQEALKFLKKMR